MRAWFVRNAVSLVVIVLAVPALIWVLLGWRLVERAEYAPTAIEVPQGESVESHGYTWTLVAGEEFPSGAENTDIPDGLALAAAIIQVRPGTDPDLESSCDETLTSRAGGTELSWSTLSSPGDFNYALLDDSTDICLLDGEPFDLEVVFLTPIGAYGESTVDLDVGGLDGSEVLRFELPPASGA